MPRYEEMDDLLRRVRERLAGQTVPIDSGVAETCAAANGLRLEEQYERILACTQALLRDAELLRELTGTEQVHTLTATQHEHVLSNLNAVMQELWSSEVTLRRAGLHD